ncbi:MAG: SAM-dependent methyltransferase [Hyphomonadaceae bacterium]|nr:SAM-dependent methyltransferase [Hyphomonadaceae bacterium]
MAGGEGEARVSGAASGPPSLKQRIAALIAQDGPMPVSQFMTLALHDPVGGYYARHARLGADGDFVTAPGISQMFGELVGLWCAHGWAEMGGPAPVSLIELGPGAGTMMADIWRAARAAPGFRDAARITLVETSAPLRTLQQRALADAPARWASALSAAPAGPALIVANEFLDCLPIRQFVRTAGGWRERVVGLRGEALAFGLAPPQPGVAALIPAALQDAPEGAVAEAAVGLEPLIAEIAARLRAHPGRALFIDYGAAAPSPGDTLQAVRGHSKVDPLDDPGGADLTAHVDFAAVARHARAHGLDVAGPVAQGAWLRALGIDARAQALSAARPEKAAAIARQRARLVDDDAMGVLFQVICLSTPGLPSPAGFA